MREITTPEVRDRQRAQLSSDEIAALKAVKRQAVTQSGIAMDSAGNAVTRAVEHIFERKSVVNGHEIIAEALNRSLGFINLDAMRRYMTSAYNGILRLTRNDKNPLESSQWASRRGLRLERYAVEFVNQTQNQCSPLGATENVAFDFKSDEQRKAVLETLNNRDRVYAIRGRAGTGKTTCLSEIRKGLEAAGRTAIYLAPTSSAVEVLRNDGFTNATTVDSFLKNREHNKTGNVIIIDESSLQSNEMGAAVLQAARNARFLFVGDTRQHVSVEAGDFLRVLEQHSNLRYSELKDIRRQDLTTAKEYNAAVRAMSQGDAAGGMKRLDDCGFVKEGRGAYIEQAADVYLAATAEGTDLNRCIAISPTWDENHRFTDAIRRKLRERQLLYKGVAIAVCHQLDWTAEQRKTAANYRAGMLVTFNSNIKSIPRGKTFEVERIESGNLWLKGHGKPLNAKAYADKFSVSLPRTIELSEGDKILIRRNHKQAGLINGKVLTVDKINANGSIKTCEGKTLPSDFRHFAHGYVVTSYKSQGRTHDYEVIAAEKLDAKSAYVACSRGRKSINVFTPDKENLFKNLGTPVDRTAAYDVLDKERNKLLHQDEDVSFRQNINNPLTKAAIQYARHAKYNIKHNGNYEKDFQPKSNYEFGM